MKKRSLKTLFLSIVIILSTSCEREFDNNPDFKLNEPVQVLGDNTLLFSKIFQITGSGAYLWFDIRNEIANFSSPFLDLPFSDNGVARYKRIDLRGRLYQYNAENDELIILDYPLNIVTDQDLPADIVYSFGRKQKEGCELIADAAQKRSCERTFTMQMKRIVFKDAGLTLEINKEADYNGKILKLSEMNQDIMLIN